MLSDGVIAQGMKNSHSDVVSLDHLPPITRMETGISALCFAADLSFM